MALRAVFGGTFDPVHLGHLRCAWEVAERLDATVHMIPAARPVHRGNPGASAEQRLAMLKRALAGQDRLIVDDRELRRDGPSWTIDTLASLAAEHADDDLCLCIGMDAFTGLASWHRWTELVAHAHLVVMTRPGRHPSIAPELAAHLDSRWIDEASKLNGAEPGRVVELAVTSLAISSSGIREVVSAGASPRFLVPARVLDYIDRHGLYRGEGK